LDKKWMMMRFAFVSLNRHSYGKDPYSFIYIITKEKEKENLLWMFHNE